MKKNKILLPMMALSLVFGVGLAACNDNAPSKSSPSASVPAKERITVTAAGDKKTLVMEETVQLTASVEGVAWKSSNEKIATVDATGKVTAIGPGTATITASKENYNNGTISITVTRPAALATLHFEDADHYAADGWWGTAEEGYSPIYARDDGNASDKKCIANMDNGDKETLSFTSTAAIKAELVMMMASREAVSDMSEVMSIKLNGKDVNIAGKSLTGGNTDNFEEFSLGEQDIVQNDNVLSLEFKAAAPYIDDLHFYTKQQATINVKQVAAKETIEVSNPELSLNRGETAQINVSKPTDKTGVKYVVGNEDYATVNATGLVTGEALGSTYVIVSKEGMISKRVNVTITDTPVPGEIRVEAEAQADDFDWEALGFHKYPDGSYIKFAHSGGAYVTGYDVSSEVSLTYTFNSDKNQTMNLIIAAAPHYNMKTGEEFVFATDATIKLNTQNVTVNPDAKIVGDGAAMGAKTQNVTIGDVQVKQGENTFVIEFHGKAPALDCFKFIPKN